MNIQSVKSFSPAFFTSTKANGVENQIKKQMTSLNDAKMMQELAFLGAKSMSQINFTGAAMDKLEIINQAKMGKVDASSDVDVQKMMEHEDLFGPIRVKSKIKSEHRPDMNKYIGERRKDGRAVAGRKDNEEIFIKDLVSITKNCIEGKDGFSVDIGKMQNGNIRVITYKDNRIYLIREYKNSNDVYPEYLVRFSSSGSLALEAYIKDPCFHLEGSMKDFSDVTFCDESKPMELSEPEESLMKAFEEIKENGILNDGYKVKGIDDLKKDLTIIKTENKPTYGYDIVTGVTSKGVTRTIYHNEGEVSRIVDSHSGSEGETVLYFDKDGELSCISRNNKNSNESLVVQLKKGKVEVLKVNDFSQVFSGNNDKVITIY